MAGCIVFFVFFAVYRRRRKGGPKHAISMAGDVEMSTKLRRRQESESRYWVPPPPLPSGDPKSLKSIQQRQWQKKAEGRTHRSKVSSGFETFRNTKRMSTFDKFLMSKGLPHLVVFMEDTIKEGAHQRVTWEAVIGMSLSQLNMAENTITIKRLARLGGRALLKSWPRWAPRKRLGKRCKVCKS